MNKAPVLSSDRRYVNASATAYIPSSPAILRIFGSTPLAVCNFAKQVF